MLNGIGKVPLSFQVIFVIINGGPALGRNNLRMGAEGG
jgi:hypothetical protein